MEDVLRVDSHIDDQYNTSLISAAADGLFEKVRQLIAAKANLELQDDWGMTALSYAVEKDHSHIVKLLADANAVLEYPNSDNTPLVCAAKRGLIEVVEVLLAANANVNIEDANGHTALWHAQNEGHEDIVEVLLDANASYGEGAIAAASDADTVSVSEGTQPIRDKADENEDWEARPETNLCAARASLLYDAACETNVVVLEKLLSTNASLNWRNADGHTPLIQAVIDKNMAAVLLLLEHRADVDMSDSDNRTALIHAAIKNDGAMLMTLLDASASVDHVDLWNLTAFNYAVHNGNRMHSQLLINANATLDTPSRDALEDTVGLVEAARYGFLWRLEALLEAKVSPDVQANGESALMIAIKHERYDAAKLLINANATVDVTQSVWQTALIRTVCQGNSVAINLLLRCNVSPNTVDASNQTALMCAVDRGRFEAMGLLLDAKANIDVTDPLWEVVLVQVLDSNEPKALQSLLDVNMSPNLSVGDMNLLERAALRQNLASIRVLIEAKATLDLSDSRWPRILIEAAMRDEFDTVKLLVEAKISVSAIDMNNEVAMRNIAVNGELSFMKRFVQYRDSKAIEGLFEFSVQSDQFHVAQSFINAKAQVDAHESYWYQAMIRAISNGYTSAVDQILHLKISPNIVSSGKKPLLMHAVERDQFGAAQLLINAKARVDKKEGFWYQALVRAVRSGKKSVVEHLLDWKISPNIVSSGRKPPLVQAVECDQFGAAQLLINAKAQVDEKKTYWYQAMVRAARKSKIDTVEQILSCKISPDIVPSGKTTPLMNAVECGHFGVALSLINAKARVDVDKTPWQQVMMKAGHHREYTTQHLLDSKVSPSFFAVKEQSPLIEAAAHGQLTMAQFLLDAKAPIDPAHSFWERELIYAATNGRDMSHLAAALLRAKVSPNTVDDKNEVVLTRAIAQTKIKIAQLLIDAKATITPHHERWQTALIDAIKDNGDTVASLVELILNMKVVPSGTEKTQKTALMHASSMGNDAVIKLLLESLSADTCPFTFL